MGEILPLSVGKEVIFGKRIFLKRGLAAAETARWARFRQTLLKEKLTSYLVDDLC